MTDTFNMWYLKNKLFISIFLVLFFSWILFIFISFFVLYSFVINQLTDVPDINKLNEITLQGKVEILDKNGNLLYDLYKDEKRTYVPYDSISKNLINAIVSIEDKSFFQNKWVDIFGIARAWFEYVSGKNDKVQWTSTISQQLIKNIFLSNERTIKRKIQEIYLSYLLNKNFSKENVLELYLNKITFWNNTYWIEEASKLYFWKSANDLSVLESSILASLPKWPSYYSPYSWRNELMGYLYKMSNENPDKNIISLNTTLVLDKIKIIKFKVFIKNLKAEKINKDLYKICNIKDVTLKNWFVVDENQCISIHPDKIVSFLNSIQFIKNSENADNYEITEYQTWRKDLVLMRMLEDEKIEISDFFESVSNWINLKFSKWENIIKYPYFVFYVKDYLEKKYWKDKLYDNWIKVYTTIDSKIQDSLQIILDKHAEKNMSYKVWNEALISIDNKNWHIVAMIWWKDYYGEESGAEVNMITSSRQPWSTFKPLEYALAISKFPIWPETPIYDVKTSFWWWTPNNYDLSFKWNMTLKTALWNSRNIPAAKIFQMVWWEKEVVNFVNTLWINSISHWKDYWVPMSLWTAEVTPLEMAQAYSVFANLWYKKDITPILKIYDYQGNLIEDNETSYSTWTKIFSESASYIINRMLSDETARPSWFWNNALTIPKRLSAAKTGTSNKVVKKNWKEFIAPRDLWTAGYTPQFTTIVWAWNTNGSETSTKADGLNCAAPIWKEAMEKLHEWLPEEKWNRPETVYKEYISKITGLSSEKNKSNSIETIFANKPSELANYKDWKYIEVDWLCNWVITKYTPKKDIKTIFIYDKNISPIVEQYAWISQQIDVSKYFSNLSYGVNKSCNRIDKSTLGVSWNLSLSSWNVILGTNHFNFSWNSKSRITKVTVTLNWDNVYSWNPNSTSLNFSFSKDLSFSLLKENKFSISIKFIDGFWYSYSYNKTFSNKVKNEIEKPIEHEKDLNEQKEKTIEKEIEKEIDLEKEISEPPQSDIISEKEVQIEITD